MSTETLAGAAAFLSGAGSVIGAVWTIRRVRRDERNHCDLRITEMRQAYRTGLQEGLRMEKRDA